MRVRGVTPVAGLVGLAGVVMIIGGSAAVYARQYAAGTIVPSRVMAINRTPAEAVPVTLINTDPKLFPTLSVAVTSAPDMDLSDRTIARLAPTRQMWEYNVVPASDTDAAARLSAAGREGWELVTVLTTAKGNSFVFKRLGR